jgi:tRNA-dihydrouridine synthase
MNIWKELPSPFFVLAPMDDVTDTVFRRVIAECAAPDLFMTEFVNADGLQSPGRQALLKKLQCTAREQPLIAQLWGRIPANYEKTAQELTNGNLLLEINQHARHSRSSKVQGSKENRGSRTNGTASETRTPLTPQFAENIDRIASSASEHSDVARVSGIDINMGCPDKTVLKNGCCSALIDNRQLAGQIIQATKKGANGKLPVSVKTRLGLDKIDLSWHEFLLNQGIDALIIHGRTAKNMSDVPADWHTIAKIREMRDKIAPHTKIIGNGDVLTRVQGSTLYSQYGVDGIMIGRGIFQDPFAFAADSPWAEYSEEQRINLYRRHVRLFAETWGPEQRKVHTLNKFCKMYIHGFDGAKELRERCMRAKTTEELLDLLNMQTTV